MQVAICKVVATLSISPEYQFVVLSIVFGSCKSTTQYEYTCATNNRFRCSFIFEYSLTSQI